MANRERSNNNLDYLLQKARSEQRRQLRHMRPFNASQILLSAKQNLKRETLLKQLQHRLLSIREVYGIMVQRPLLLIIGCAAIMLMTVGAFLLFVAINPANVNNALLPLQQLENLQYLFELNSLEERYNLTLINVGISIF